MTAGKHDALGAGGQMAAGASPDHSSPAPYPGTPRWVKAFGIVVLALALLVVVLLVAGGGGHGPGRHQPSGSPAAPSAPLANGAPSP